MYSFVFLNKEKCTINVKRNQSNLRRILGIIMQMKRNHGMNTPPEYIERHILIGRMNGIALQPESHQNGFDTKHLLKIRKDADALPRRMGIGSLPKASENPATAACQAG